MEPEAATVKLQGELTLHLPSKEWLSTKIAWPFDMSSVSSEGEVLARARAEHMAHFGDVTGPHALRGLPAPANR